MFPTTASYFTHSNQRDSKVVVGLPVFARHKDRKGDVKSHAELVDANDGVAPKSEPTREGYSGVSINSATVKTRDALAAGYAGVFFW